MTGTTTFATRLRRGIFASTALAALAVCGPVAAQTYPLTTLPDDGDRDFWWYHQVVDADVLEAMQNVVGEAGVPVSVTLDQPVRIAVVYPSQDVSDFWLRAYRAMAARLAEMEIPFEDVQFASGMDGHELQVTYIDQILQDAEDFDYVVFGPTELTLQADNIKRVIDHPGLKVIILNYDQVPQDWGDEQPLAFTGFSHLAGALNMCEYVLENVGTSGIFAMIRGTPGSIDNQRSDGFRNCLEEKSDWEMAYEHYGNFLREGGFDGGNLIMTGYPEVTLIHNANTAMGMGALSAAEALDKLDEIFITAWGGTGDELEALREKILDATPMRMGDDVGAAVAEIIKADLEGRGDDIPLVFLGRIGIAHKGMSAEEIDALETEAFRYTGKGTIER